PTRYFSNMAGSLVPRKFNDDILLNDGDRALAAKVYPEIVHVLDYPELCELFAEYEHRANRAKKTGLRMGLTAIALDFLALSVAATELLLAHDGSKYSSENAIDWVGLALAIGASIFGVSSVLVGSMGMLSAKRKREWLYCRLVTERIRQW